MKSKNFIFRVLVTSCSWITMCVALALFASCATSRTSNSTPIYRVYMTNTKRVALLPPNAMSGNIDNLYLMNAQFGDDTFSVLSYIVANNTGISADLLSDFGSSLGTLFYDEKGITLESEIFPKNLPPQYVVMDFQNAFYDVRELQTAYEKSRMKFECSIADGENETTEMRMIYDGKKIIEDIKIKTSVSGETTITINNFLRGYSYTLMTR